jgi:hypothetical protein
LVLYVQKRLDYDRQCRGKIRVPFLSNGQGKYRIELENMNTNNTDLVLYSPDYNKYKAALTRAGKTDSWLNNNFEIKQIDIDRKTFWVVIEGLIECTHPKKLWLVGEQNKKLTVFATVDITPKDEMNGVIAPYYGKMIVDEDKYKEVLVVGEMQKTKISHTIFFWDEKRNGLAIMPEKNVCMTLY